MKCPKCSYLGFETGDRCRNCGYDFSLLAVEPPAVPDPELTIRSDEADTGAPEVFIDRLDRSMDEASPLPLFDPHSADDAPLIALPAAPRPPLSVRRTPDTPRLRAVPRVAWRVEPALNFREEIEDEAAEPSERMAPARQRPTRAIDGTREVGVRRLVAALIDHSILLAIDLSVVYFTLRMAGLDGSAVRALPAAPLLTFLALVKLAYFIAFTAVGGQTIGKMTVGIRVIAEHGEVDGARAIRRTFAGILSLLPLGLGFLPAFFGADRRTLHDRLTHTRVVGLPSA